MVNCKFFFEILYLRKKKGSYNIILQTKGVMATRLGESQDLKKKREKSQIIINQLRLLKKILGRRLLREENLFITINKFLFCLFSVKPSNILQDSLLHQMGAQGILTLGCFLSVNGLERLQCLSLL